ncbi:hypothetical protein BCV70DRAFT_67016 [Testicularia cyperi]|uniref:H-type lectin domain-containing protein n=1 Tax=Testicularia cyperi TaxID=1882483 RepID=A0A317XGI1_9BASI|nr:hypothetical protein BCV70DRAFT_67016 [Testicularia cyperi]
MTTAVSVPSIQSAQLVSAPIKSGLQPPFFCISTRGSDGCKAWPLATRLLVRLHGSVHPIVRQALEETLQEWKDQVKIESMKLEWVAQDQPSHIRISVGSGPSWCQVGASCYGMDDNQPNAHLGLDGWQSDGFVWKRAELQRAARHMWGHIYGLDHAYNEDTRWNTAEVERVCRSINVSAEQVLKRRGDPALNNLSSIMHFDRPANLIVAGSAELTKISNTEIDQTSTRVLQRLYAKNLEVETSFSLATEMHSFDPTEKRDVEIGVKWKATERTSNICVAINHIDIAPNANFRLRHYYNDVSPGQGFRMHQGSWGGTQLVQSSAHWLTFSQSDDRVQTGKFSSTSIRERKGQSWVNAVPGESFAERIVFARPYSKPPKVVACLSGFDTDRLSNVRVDVFAGEIDSYGFTLHMNSWSTTIPYDISVNWLAHNADDTTIRSGRLEFGGGTNVSASGNYDSRFSQRPRFLWYGFCTLDLRNGVNLRIRMDVDSWTESAVSARASTWANESEFYNAKGIYVAFL